MSATPKNQHEDSELFRIFANSDDPVLTAVEVAEELDISQQAAHARLSKAHERGEIKRKKTGSRAVVWWPSDQSATSR